MRLYVLKEFDGEPGESAALVFADDPDEARSLAAAKTGRHARACTEVQAERGVWGLFGIGAVRPVIVRAEQTCGGCPSIWNATDSSGYAWELYFRWGSGTATRHVDTEPGLELSFDHDDHMLGVITLEEFCQRAGLELRLS